MARRMHLVRRLTRIFPVMLLLLAGIAPFALGRSGAAAQDRPALIVDDAATANPDLVSVTVADPHGFGVTGRTLMAPPGTTIAVVGANLGGPRFMTFDGAGNLLVAAQDDGAVYRFPFADGDLGQPEKLITGLNQPSNVALFTTNGADYLYVGETQQIGRYRYDPAGPVGRQEIVIPDLPTGGHTRAPSPSDRTASSTWRSAPPATSARRRTRSGRPSPAPSLTAAICELSPPGCATRSASPSSREPIASGRQ